MFLRSFFLSDSIFLCSSILERRNLKSSRLSIFLGPENDDRVSVISKSRITIIASVTSSRVFMTKSQLRYCHSRNSFSPTSFLHFFQGFCTLCDVHFVLGCEINVSLRAPSSEREFFIICEVKKQVYLLVCIMVVRDYRREVSGIGEECPQLSYLSMLSCH